MRAPALVLVALVAASPALAADPEKTAERRSTALAEAFADVAAKVAPSVVALRSAGGDDLGLGAVIDDGTYILTSRAILERAVENHVSVRGAAGETGYASILARNEAYDVALLRLQTRGARLTPLPLGRSGDLAVGQWVVSGGPSLARPLAVGVVSALGRRVEPLDRPAGTFDVLGLLADSPGPSRVYARVIQHDSPIDGDNHGAPLVDVEGRLVGINVARPYRGSSYAAPIDEIAAFLPDLKAGKAGPPAPRPGFIGVTVGAIADRAIAKRLGVIGPGVQIHDLATGLPAEKAGLRAGDVILAVEGERIGSHERFGIVVRGTTPGRTVAVRVLREGKEIDLPVVIGERPPGE